MIGGLRGLLNNAKPAFKTAKNPNQARYRAIVEKGI
jgi:hypothetical protein